VKGGPDHIGGNFILAANSLETVMNDSTCSLLLTKYVKQQMMLEGCLALCSRYQEGMLGKLHLI